MMIDLKNCFIGFHTNFDPEKGTLSEPGWVQKEVLLIWVTEKIDKNAMDCMHVSSSDGETIVFKNGQPFHIMEGNVFDIQKKDVEFNEIIIEVKNIEEFVKLSKSFFDKTIKDFEMNDSPLGQWFDPGKRNEILLEKAFERSLKDGTYNHVIPIISMPFTKDVFKEGELTPGCPCIFTSVFKKPMSKV